MKHIHQSNHHSKNDMNCDIHILSIPGRDSWLDEAVDSLSEEPVNIFLVEGVIGHSGKGRAKGFSKGNSKYVSFMDDDDLVEKGAVRKLIDLLEDTPEAVGAFSLSDHMDADGNITGSFRKSEQIPELSEWKETDAQRVHQLIVYRREFVEKYLHIIEQENRHPDIVLNRLVGSHGPFVCLREVGYYWRIHDKCSHKNHKKPSKFLSNGRSKDLKKMALGTYFN